MAEPVFRFRATPRGPHVEVRVFVGVDTDHLQLAGTLVLTPDQWASWQKVWEPYALPEARGRS